MPRRVNPWFARATAALSVLLIAAAPALRTQQLLKNSAGQTLDNWGLDRIDQRARPLDGRFNYDLAGRGVNIYIIDSGVQLRHTDFTGRIQVVGNFSLHPDMPSPADDVSDCATEGLDGHGTHQASYAAGTRYGVAKAAAIWVLKAADARCAADWTAVVKAVDWVTAHGRKPAVVNFSWRPTLHGIPDLDRAVARSIQQGFVYTLSAGSVDEVTNYWSTDVLDAALAVGGTDAADCVHVNTNPGDCRVPARYGPHLALFAPAVGTRSAGAGSADAVHASDSECAGGCDSYAAPHAAGVAAMYLELHPSATPAEVRQGLIAAATTGAIRNAGASPNRLLYSRGFK